MPIAEWLKGPLCQWANAEVNNSESFEKSPLMQDSLRKLLNIHDSGNGARIRFCGRDWFSWISWAVCRPHMKNSFQVECNMGSSRKASRESS